jgi:ADP-ribose pyrophosphatase YjhB (NUDIX family)
MGWLRNLAGDDRTLILVGAMCVVRDEAGRVLLIRRSDNGAWALPAGSIELGENLRDCAVREVHEETGLLARELTPFGIFCRPAHTPNMYGHSYQTITLGCRVDAYQGELERSTDETIDAGFFATDGFPDGTRPSVGILLAALAHFEADGQFVLE